MATRVVLLQADTIFSVPAAVVDNNNITTPGLIEQPLSEAVDVSAYQFVTPFLRIRTDPLNAIPAEQAANATVVISFATAPFVEPGFSPTNPAVNLPTSSFATIVIADRYPDPNNQAPVSPGKTYVIVAPNSPGFPDTTPRAITNPGGLLYWRCFNNYLKPVRFRADLYLVCRGPG